ncbi:hypothetical protein [Brachybacterium squillarum]|nr:hypothetical protein [Brachybacterium squillarum]
MVFIARPVNQMPTAAQASPSAIVSGIAVSGSTVLASPPKRIIAAPM